jgi:hypothetical protein
MRRFFWLLLIAPCVQAQEVVPPLSAILSWTAPTELIDGTPMPMCIPSDPNDAACLDGFEIHAGPVSGSYDEIIEILDQSVTTYLYDGAERGEVEVFFAAKAYLRSTERSDFSNEAVKTLVNFEQVSGQLIGLPLDFHNSGFPQSGQLTVSLPYLPLGNVTLTMQVFDADQTNEGDITVGSWTEPLFGSQRGGDQVTGEIVYVIPESEFSECDITVDFTHTSTGGYRIEDAVMTFEKGSGCQTIPPPVVREMPIMRIE